MRLSRRLFRLALFIFVALVVLAASFARSPASSPHANPHTLALGPHIAAAGSCPGGQFAYGVYGAPNACMPDSQAIPCQNGGGVPANAPTGLFCAMPGMPPPPPPVPDRPGINAGAACLAGDTRTVTLSPGNNSGGATYTLRMATTSSEGSGPYTTQSGSGTSYTFSGLQQDVAYVFQAVANNQYGSSGWTAWVGPVKQDLNPPTTTYTPVGTAGTNGWWKSNVTVSLPAVDSGCLGVKTTTYTLDSNPSATYTGTPFPVNGDGIHTLSFFSTDGAHVEATQTQTIKIDTTPPVLNMTPSRPPDTTYGWWHSTPIITLAVSDATSGVASTVIQIDGGAWTAWNGKTITFQGDLKHTLNVKVTDNAGNVTTNGWVFQVDSTPPQVGLNYDKPHGPNGWFTSSPVEVYLTTSDNLAGIALTMIRVDGGPMDSSRVSVAGDGVHIVAWFVYDKAGNQNVSMLPVQIDTTPPDVGSVSCGPSSIAPGQSWSLSASVGDNASGVSRLVMNVNGAETGNTLAGFAPGTLSASVTLGYTPNTLGHYSVDLVLSDYAEHVTTRTGVCSFSVTQPILYSAVRKPTKTFTPNLRYEIVTNTPTLTATGTQNVQPTGTIPPTNTPGADGVGGADATQAAISPTSTATSTPLAVAMVLPGDNGGTPDSGLPPWGTPPPDLNTLLEQAGLLGGAGAAVAISGWALQQGDEQKKKKARQQAALQLALGQQSQQAQQNYTKNQNMQNAAQADVQIASSPSDAWLAYEAALNAYYEGIASRERWAQNRMIEIQQQAIQQQEQQAEQAQQAAEAALAYANKVGSELTDQRQGEIALDSEQLTSAQAWGDYRSQELAFEEAQATADTQAKAYADFRQQEAGYAVAQAQSEAIAPGVTAFRSQELATDQQTAQADAQAQMDGQAMSAFRAQEDSFNEGRPVAYTGSDGGQVIVSSDSSSVDANKTGGSSDANAWNAFRAQEDAFNERRPVVYTRTDGTEVIVHPDGVNKTAAELRDEFAHVSGLNDSSLVPNLPITILDQLDPKSFTSYGDFQNYLKYVRNLIALNGMDKDWSAPAPGGGSWADYIKTNWFSTNSSTGKLQFDLSKSGLLETVYNNQKQQQLYYKLALQQASTKLSPQDQAALGSIHLDNLTLPQIEALFNALPKNVAKQAVTDGVPPEVKQAVEDRLALENATLMLVGTPQDSAEQSLLDQKLFDAQSVPDQDLNVVAANTLSKMGEYAFLFEKACYHLPKDRSLIGLEQAWAAIQQNNPDAYYYAEDQLKQEQANQSKVIEGLAKAGVMLVLPETAPVILAESAVEKTAQGDYMGALEDALFFGEGESASALAKMGNVVMNAAQTAQVTSAMINNAPVSAENEPIQPTDTPTGLQNVIGKLFGGSPQLAPQGATAGDFTPTAGVETDAFSTMTTITPADNQLSENTSGTGSDTGTSGADLPSVDTGKPSDVGGTPDKGQPVIGNTDTPQLPAGTGDSLFQSPENVPVGSAATDPFAALTDFQSVDSQPNYIGETGDIPENPGGGDTGASGAGEVAAKRVPPGLDDLNIHSAQNVSPKPVVDTLTDAYTDELPRDAPQSVSPITVEVNGQIHTLKNPGEVLSYKSWEILRDEGWLSEAEFSELAQALVNGEPVSIPLNIPADIETPQQLISRLMRDSFQNPRNVELTMSISPTAYAEHGMASVGVTVGTHDQSGFIKLDQDFYNAYNDWTRIQIHPLDSTRPLLQSPGPSSTDILDFVRSLNSTDHFYIFGYDPGESGFVRNFAYEAKVLPDAVDAWQTGMASEGTNYEGYQALKAAINKFEPDYETIRDILVNNDNMPPNILKDPQGMRTLQEQIDTVLQKNPNLFGGRLSTDDLVNVLYDSNGNWRLRPDIYNTAMNEILNKFGVDVQTVPWNTLQGMGIAQ